MSAVVTGMIFFEPSRTYVTRLLLKVRAEKFLKLGQQTRHMSALVVNIKKLLEPCHLSAFC